MTETFRYSKSIRIHGLVTATSFLALIIGFSGPFLADDATIRRWGYSDDRSAVHMTCLADILFGSFFASSVYTIAAGYLGRVSVDGSRVSFRSVFATQEFDAPEVESVKWKSQSVELEIPNRKVVLHLNCFSSDDRLKIIRLMRQRFPEGKQEGWAKFCQTTALSLRDGTDSADRAQLTALGFADDPFIIIRRNRYNWIAYTLVPLSLVLAFGLWWKTGVMHYLALLPLAVWFFLMLHFSVPRGGRRVLRITASPGNRLGLGIGILVIVLMLAMVAPAILGLRAVTALRFLNVMAGVAVLMVILLVGAFWRLERSAQRALNARAESALRQWEAGEGNAT